MSSWHCVIMTGAIALCATHLGPSQAATTSTESFSQVSPRSKQITLGRQVRNWLGSPFLSIWIGGGVELKILDEAKSASIHVPYEELACTLVRV